MCERYHATNNVKGHVFQQLDTIGLTLILLADKYLLLGCWLLGCQWMRRHAPGDTGMPENRNAEHMRLINNPYAE